MSPAIFSRCIDRRITKDGHLEIKCKLGLWCVSGRDHEFVHKQARWYWLQYFDDGEYRQLLARNT
jgi:hypothetical protein